MKKISAGDKTYILEEVQKLILSGARNNTAAMQACALIKEHGLILSLAPTKKAFTKWSFSKFDSIYNVPCERCSNRIPIGTRYFFLNGKSIHLDCATAGEKEASTTFNIWNFTKTQIQDIKKELGKPTGSMVEISEPALRSNYIIGSVTKIEPVGLENLPPWKPGDPQ